jgi:hypothetical protein
MGIIKVLKRKDGAALVVGVALAITIANFLTTITFQLSLKLSDMSASANQESGGWRTSYLEPLIGLILSIIALELLVWVYVWIHQATTNKK